MNQLQQKLTELNACDDAIEWAKDYKTLQIAWDNCKRSDWMIWLINNQGWSNDKDLRLMAVKFAREVQHLMQDERSINALDVAERFANGEATQKELAAAWDSAWAAASSAARAAEWAAASSVAWDSAWVAARAAAWDAARAVAWDSAWAAARAAEWAAARAVAWDSARAKQSDIIRTFLPKVKF